MSAFLFDGKSRPNRMQLVRDTHKSKEKLIDEAHQRQVRRDEERRRGRAATRIQRAVRELLAQQQVIRLAFHVFAQLPDDTRVYADAQQQQQHAPTAATLSPAQLGRLCWCFQYIRDREALIPVSLLRDQGQGVAVTATNRGDRARAVVRTCSGKLVASVRQLLTQQSRGSGGGFQTMLSELLPSAVGFLVYVLLDDYAASLAENNGSCAEKAFRGLAELCKAAAACATDSAAPDTDSGAVLVCKVVCSCLSFSASRLSRFQTARNRLLGLLTPLLPLCAPAVAIAPADAVRTEEEEEWGSEGVTALVAPRERSLGSSMWAEACWAALTSPHDDTYLPLSSNPVAALLSAEEVTQGMAASSGGDCGPVDTAVVLMVVQVAYDRIVLRSFMDGPAPKSGTEATGDAAAPTSSLPGSSSAPNRRWWEPSAMAVLGRLTRLLPIFLHYTDGKSTADDAASRQERRVALNVWLRCVGGLCERLCQRETFTQSILFDLHHSRLQLMASGAGSTIDGGAASRPNTKPQQQQQPPERDVAAAAAAALGHRGGKYRSLASHLFSSEGGLKLMEQLATTASALPTTTSTGEIGDEEEKGASAGKTDGGRPRRRLRFFPRDEEAQLLSMSELEAVCGVYAWPLFTFSLTSPQNRLESAAVFAKLVHTPQLLRQLWCLYRSRCEGLAALLPPGELLEKLCGIATRPNVAVRMPFWLQPPASVLAEKGLHGRQGMFWDPNPAFAALFFTLLGYYVDVTDFTHDLQRETVLTQKESWALILALKEVVHRSHFHGVVPGANCEAVAHLAYILLSKLHVINESSSFVPYPSLWISTTDEGIMRVLGGITPEQWENLSLKRSGEQRRLERKMGGEGDDHEDDTDDARSESETGTRGGDRRDGGGDADAEDAARASARNAVVPQFLSSKYNKDMAKAAAVAAAQRRQRLPGSDVAFEESTSWPLEERVARLLMHTPFLIPFPQRAALLTMLLLQTQPPRLPGRPTFFVVHRGRTFVDTFERFHSVPDSPDMFSVRFAAAPGAASAREPRRGRGGFMDAIQNAFRANGSNEGEAEGEGEAERDRPQGLPRRRRHQQQQAVDSDEELERQHEGLEEGYGQGVYRELMVSVCKEGFDASHGLFLQTEDGYVYPNPFSFEATGDPLHLQKIGFLGTMVGRAFRDGILQDFPFALHFRNSLLSRRNSINNLRSYDAQLYQQLMSLSKMSKEEIESMCLTFTYDVNALGITKEVELIKGGAGVQVTLTNCLHYIQLVADFKLNREGAQQTLAFKAGLEAIIKPSWLQLFDSNELLNLLGGDQSGKIDLQDWREHTTYTPPDAKNSAPVKLFWDVVTSLTNEQQSKLLKFATSMNRPPLLGFRFLSPQFNIHMLPEATVNRLPTASTCFSMLKLPPYKDYASARAKIIAAIEETSSFGLT